MTPSQEYAEKASQEYAEKLAEDPSQFYDDEPEESKAAAKAAKKAADVKVAVQAAAGAGADNEEESDLVKQLRAELAAANAKSAKKRAPKGLYKTKCDDALKNIKPTIKYIFDKHKDEHLDLYLLGLYVKQFENRLTEDDDHDGFKKWLTDNKESIGLKKQTRKSGVGSTNVSVALGDLTIDQDTIDDDEDEDEDAGAGAGAGAD